VRNYPNVLMIVCDQLRNDCLGYNNVYPVKTPNIDALAAEGMRFTNAFTSIPLCCPARQSLLTGVRAENFGCLWNLDVANMHGLQPGMLPTWPERMRDIGYNMAYIGKWDVDKQKSPLDFGYDYYYGMEHYDQFRREKYPNESKTFDWFGEVDDIPSEDSRIDVQAEKVIEQLNKYTASGAPWHIRLDYSEPHLPCNPTAEYAELYRAEDMEPWGSFGDTFEDKPYIQRQQLVSWDKQDKPWSHWADNVARYFATITQIDAAVGRILTALKESGQEDNTLIIFTADHGDMCGSHGMMDKLYVMYDDIVRIPTVIKWNGHIVPGSVYEDFATPTIDLPATLFDILGGDMPPMQGISLMPIFRGEITRPYRTEVLSSFNGNQFGFYKQRMLRDKKWKYIWNLTDVDELYDMENDPWELTNLIHNPEHAELISGMRKRLYKTLEKEEPNAVYHEVWIKHQLYDGHKL